MFAVFPTITLHFIDFDKMVIRTRIPSHSLINLSLLLIKKGCLLQEMGAILAARLG
jgi:hypothetical protein